MLLRGDGGCDFPEYVLGADRVGDGLTGGLLDLQHPATGDPEPLPDGVHEDRCLGEEVVLHRGPGPIIERVEDRVQTLSDGQAGLALGAPYRCHRHRADQRSTRMRFQIVGLGHAVLALDVVGQPLQPPTTPGTGSSSPPDVAWAVSRRSAV